MMMRKITVWLCRRYMPSLPALSVMRIAIALVVIADLLIRWPDMETFYSDEGIWPRNMVTSFGWVQGYWSLHLLSGSVGWQVTLMCIHLLAAVSMLVGWRTVISTLITWLLLVSLQNRNVYILQSGDDLLRMTLFFGIFLPWNRHYALDANGKGFVMPVSVYVYLAYLLQIASVYFFTVVLKSSAEWWSEGSAIYYALSLEQIRLPFSGDWLYEHPALMRCLTWLVLLLECAIPALILFPFKKNALTRRIAFMCILTLHAGIASTLYVGLFPYISIASSLGLLVFRHAEAPARDNTIRNSRALRAGISTVAAVASFFCLAMNLQGVPRFDYELRSFLRVPAHVLRLDQYWGMFSPSVLKLDGWFVYQGVDDLGNEWDLRENTPTVNFSKPRHIVSLYDNDRWRKLAENLQSEYYTFLRPLYARYVIRKWNREHPRKHLRMLNLYYMEKTTLPGYRRPQIKKVLYCASDGR